MKSKIDYSVSEEHDKLEVDTVVRNNVLDVLGLTKEDRKRIGKFKLNSEETISIPEVLDKDKDLFNSIGLFEYEDERGNSVW